MREALRRPNARANAFARQFDLLTALPLVGHQGALAGTREFGVSGFRYIIVYRVDVAEDALVILRHLPWGATAAGTRKKVR